MPNEAPNLFQYDPNAGLSPEPDQEADGEELAVPVMLIITSTLFMLVIYAFTHIRDITYIRMASGEDASARAAGELLGGLAFWILLLVGIGLLASRAVKPPRRMKLFAIVFAVVGSLGSIGALTAHNLAERAQRSRVDQQSKALAEILKQSASTQPANPIFNPVGTDISAVTRDYFSQITRLRRKHDQDSEQYARALSKLYSADSFSSPARMRESMQAVDGIQKIDQDFANAFGRSLGDLKTKVQASSLSARDKEEFLRGVNHGLGSSEVVATWKDLQKAEDKWSKATHAFYGFALTQSSSIKVENGHVQIVGEDVRQEFTSRMHECADLSNRVMTASRTMALKQQAGMKNMGVTRSDLGLQK